MTVTTPAIPYKVPNHWIKYQYEKIKDDLLQAKANILALKAIPFQRRWVRELADVQLKLEVGGSSRIEGADFAANELEDAIRAESAEQLMTRSQRQALALAKAYRHIADVPNDAPIDVALVLLIHRIVVTECDEDHCDPGRLRIGDDQVVFGIPRHRGALAGSECAEALDQLISEFASSYRQHDPLIQALALHYHFAAMHPFPDGNGRTARVLEALALRRAGLGDSLFIAMSNYYYDEKREYLTTMAAVRAFDHDLTPFVSFALKGISAQTGRLAAMVKRAVSKEIFRSFTHDLFLRMESSRKRVIANRQLVLLERLLEADGEVEFFEDFVSTVKRYYQTRRDPLTAIIRDMNRLIGLGAVRVNKMLYKENEYRWMVSVDLDWPARITDTEFFARLANLKKSKTARTLVY